MGSGSREGDSWGVVGVLGNSPNPPPPPPAYGPQVKMYALMGRRLQKT